MKERPITFSTEMIEAILEGRKIAFREPIPPSLPHRDYYRAFRGIQVDFESPHGKWIFTDFLQDEKSPKWPKEPLECPFRQGTKLKVRERRKFLWFEFALPTGVTLEVTNIDAQGLHRSFICTQDLIDSGAVFSPDEEHCYGHNDHEKFHKQQKKFIELYNSNCEEYWQTWEADPLCWIVEFERVKGEKDEANNI